MARYVCFYKISSKPVLKGSRVEIIGAAREEYKKLSEEGWGTTSFIIVALIKNFQHSI